MNHVHDYVTRHHDGDEVKLCRGCGVLERRTDESPRLTFALNEQPATCTCLSFSMPVLAELADRGCPQHGGEAVDAGPDR